MSDDICDNNTPSSKQTKFLLLLVSLLALMVLEPFLFDYTRLRFLLDIFISIILFASIYAVSEKRRTTPDGNTVGLTKIWDHMGSWFYHPSPAFFFDPFSRFIFIGYIIVLILNHIFRQKNVTLETIYGAIAVYILIGLVWVFLYNLTEFSTLRSFSLTAVLR